MAKKINVDKVSEGVDYELIPVDDSPNDQAWDIRILRGDFTETVIRYGNVAFNEIKDCLTFNYKVVYTPDPFLTSDDVQLQEYAADILEDVLERAYAEGWLIAQPRN
jgi:hypothetical protein